MGHNIKVSNEAASIKADAWAAAMNGGAIRVYSGARPASGSAPIGSAVLLGELTFGSPAFPAATDGLLIANPIARETDADASGTAAFYRLFRSDGVTPMGDGECGLTGSGSDLEMPNLNIVQHGEISCTGFAHQEGLG